MPILEKNYWLETVTTPPVQFRGDLPETIDVAIVGGGFCGLSAALALAKRGVSVAVLEAETFGWGASSRNGGMVLTGMKLPVPTLIKRYGREAVRKMYAASLETIDCVEQIVRDENINCNFSRCGHLEVACKQSHFDGYAESAALIQKGATPRLEKLLAFFPGLLTPVKITPVTLSAHGDLAVLSVEDSQAVNPLQPLPLADNPSNPGELVAVIGYPMGILGMVAKSPTAVYDRLAFRRDEVGAANELAALSLIRPSATYGHLGDVVGDKLIYDAPTAHGGSGGPVFNSLGQVIGINAAYIDGFSGGTIGISVEALQPLLEAAQNLPEQKKNMTTSRIQVAAQNLKP